MSVSVLILAGCSFGLVSSAGVFTAVAATGLLPRFAGKTHTADKIAVYETLIIFGTICGMLVSIFTPLSIVCSYLFRRFSRLCFSMVGFFTGCYVGCLAIAIAEMISALPIMARRIGENEQRFQEGLHYVVVAMALGKLVGTYLYFS